MRSPSPRRMAAICAKRSVAFGVKLPMQIAPWSDFDPAGATANVASGQLKRALPSDTL